MKMEIKKVNILGSEYTLKVCSDAEEPRLDGCDGFCDETTKELFAESYSKDRDSLTCKGKLQIQINKVKRHEIIHAFLFESGLAENSVWAQNEEMVDFFAIQFPKLLDAFKAADAL